MTKAKNDIPLIKVTIDQAIEFYIRDTPADHGVIQQIFQNQDYNTKRLKRHDEIVQAYQQILAAGDRPLIIDCGANIGASAVYFATQYPEAEIIAIEPDADNYLLLQRNVANFSQIRALHCAIASHDGVLNLIDAGAGAWGYRTAADSGTDIGHHISEVACRSMQSVLAGVSSVPFLLKIDIEGAEADLFSDHLKPFNDFFLMIIELHDWMLPGQASSRNFLSWHGSTNRDFVYIGENVFSIAPP